MLSPKHAAPERGQGSPRRARSRLPRSQTLLSLTHSNQASRVAWKRGLKRARRAPSAAVITGTCRRQRAAPAASTRHQAKWNRQRRRGPDNGGRAGKE